jgi:hypothetical protein
LVPGKKAKAAALSAGLTSTQLDQILAEGERTAIKELDSRGNVLNCTACFGTS